MKDNTIPNTGKITGKRKGTPKNKEKDKDKEWKKRSGVYYLFPFKHKDYMLWNKLTPQLELIIIHIPYWSSKDKLITNTKHKELR